MEGKDLGAELRRHITFKVDEEKDEERKKRLEKLLEEWEGMYPNGFDCVCCTEMMCQGSDFSRRLNSYTYKSESSYASESDYDPYDYIEMFCFPYLGAGAEY